MTIGTAIMAAKDWTALADKMINNFGDKFGTDNNPICYHVVITVTGGDGPLDPPSEEVEELFPMNGVFTCVGKDLIGGELIQAGDIQVVATYGGIINPGDTIRRDGTDYIVIDVDPVSPYGTSIVKKFIARRN